MSIAELEKMITNYCTNAGVSIIYSPIDTGSYDDYSDTITLPATNKNDYTIILHELAHTTGKSNRLARSCYLDRANRSSYAIEELVAEFTMLLILKFFNVEYNLVDSLDYICAWQSEIKYQNFNISEAHNQAIQAMEYILEHNTPKKDLKPPVEAIKTEKPTESVEPVSEVSEDEEFKNWLVSKIF